MPDTAKFWVPCSMKVKTKVRKTGCTRHDHVIAGVHLAGSTVWLTGEWKIKRENEFQQGYEGLKCQDR